MLKVFRLLRNNSETGPFTIGELLQQQLVSSDLVWVDGESTAWAHPQEMPNLKYAVTMLSQKEEKKTCPAQDEQKRRGTLIKKEDGGKKAPEMVPLKKAPKDEIERKAEELRQRTLAYKKPPAYQPHNWVQQNSPVISLPENEVDIVYHKKPGLPVGEIMMGSMIAALLALGWYGGGKSMFQYHKEEANAVAVKMISTQDNAANGNRAKLSVVPQILALKNKHEATTDSLHHKKDTARILTFKPLHKKAILPKKDSDLIVKTTPQVLASTTETTHVKKEEPPTALQQPKPQDTKAAETKASVVPVTAEGTPPASTDKKKTIGQVLKGLFKKKRKEEQNPPEEAKPIGN